MNKRSTTGLIDATKTARYAVRSPGLITMWQNELSRSGELFNKYEISCKPIPNMLSSGFDITEHTDADLTYEATEQCKAYSFEVDGEATIYIEDLTSVWNVLATIVVPNTITTFTNYKGIVTPTTGATKSRIRFSGSYYYKTVNRALFDYPLKLAQVPSYAEWLLYQMPADFKSVSQIVDESPISGYENNSDFKWEGKKDLYVNYEYEGTIRIVYKSIPIVITALSQTLQIDDITCESGAYFLAAHLIVVEDPASASFFNERFMELKQESKIKQPSAETQILNMYGGV